MTFTELAIRVIHEQQNASSTSYFLLEPEFEHDDQSAVWEEFSQLFNHDQSTTWMHDGFQIDERRRIVESGGSGFWWEVTITAGASVPAAVIGYGMNVVLDRLVDRLGVATPPPLDRDRALNKAKWAVLQSAPQLSHDNLGEPAREIVERAGNRWSFQFDASDGCRYIIDVGWHARLPEVMRVERIPNAQGKDQALVPGNAVIRNGEAGTWIIVDITEDGLAVLRRPDDSEGMQLHACPLRDLRRVT